MLLADKAQFAVARPADDRAVMEAPAPDRNRRMIPHGDRLFAPGARRSTAFRVETGALCHYVVWPDGTHDVIEFAFPGDIVGFGALAEHVSTAQAMVDTCVIPLESDQMNLAVANDAALASRIASATDREFEYLRRRALQPGLGPVLNRIAAYLLATAGHACRSGETHIVAGDEGATSLAALLDVPTADVRDAFATLHQKALIAERDGNIVIDDVSGLEALADA
jgi:CRP/FNR family transcriptional regulator